MLFKKPLKLLWLIAIFCFIYFTASYGNVIIVSNSNDSGGGSLRVAVNNFTQDGDTIQFAPSLDTIRLTSGQITISKSILINGQSANSVIISGTGNSRIFRITAGDSVSIENLTLTNGFAASDSGGAVYNSGKLGMSYCVLKNNTASHGGAVLSNSSMVLTGCTFTGNTATTGFGGSIYSSAGSALLIDCEIMSSTSVSGGGGIACKGSCTFTNATIRDNFSNAGGGVYALNSLNMSSCTVEDNNANFGHGGGIYNAGNAKITVCTISGNHSNNASFNGGGMYNSSVLSLASCAVHDNSSAGMGGGIMNIGTASVISSTLNNNTSGTNGGGMASDGKALISNSTISNNDAGASGAAIYSTATVRIERSTLAENEAVSNGGGVFTDDSLYFSNTIITDNTAGQGKELYKGSNGLIISEGHNLVREITQSLFNPDTGDTLGTVANPIESYLGPLQNNGGSLLTHLPLCGSPAIDRGDSIGAPSTDQRGEPRIHGSGIDIGSVESQKDPVEIQAVINHESAAGAADGSIELSPTGGTSPYFYHWYNGSENNTLTNLSAGSYSVTVTDNDSCEVNGVYTVQLADGINNAEESSILIYPNPTFNSILIQHNLPQQQIEAAIFDIRGLKLKEIMLNPESEISIDELPPGSYTLELKTAQGWKSMKFLKL